MDIVQKSLTSPVTQVMGTTTPTYRFIVSTDDEDRDGDIIKQDGWQLDEFAQNPVCLLQHKHDQPVGRWTNIQTRPRATGGFETVADLTLAPPVSDVLKYANALVEAGILNATSVGFAVKSFEKRKDAKGAPRKGHIIHKALLREISLVSVPANQNAIRIAKSLGTSEEIFKTFISTDTNRVDSDIDVDSDDILPASKVVDKANEILKGHSFSKSVFKVEPKISDPQLLEAYKKALSILN